MPRKPIIQTMVATSLVLGGSADADIVAIGEMDSFHADLLETDLDEMPFFSDGIETLTLFDAGTDIDADDMLLAADRKPGDGTGRRQPDMKRPAVKQPEVKQTVPRVKRPEANDRTAPVTRKAPEAGGRQPPVDTTRTVPTDRVGRGGVGDDTTACCTVYGGTGNDAVVGGGLDRDTVYGGGASDAVGGGLISDTVYAGDPDDVIQTLPVDRTGVTGSGGARLRSSGGGGIKLRGD